MKLKDVIGAFTTPDGCGDMSAPEMLEMDVEFCTLGRDNLSLLSVYENEGKIVVDIGTEEDDDTRIATMLVNETIDLLGGDD